MPPGSSDKAAWDPLAGAAEALASGATPDASVGALLSFLSETFPGLNVWALRPTASTANHWAWVAAGDPPFPESLLDQPDSLALLAIRGSRVMEFGLEGEPARRSPEIPYLRRRPGRWIFAPTSPSSALGALVAHHRSAGSLEEARDLLVACARLMQPSLALVCTREDMDRRIEERTSELALFYETSRALAFARTTEEIASLLSQHLGRLLGCEILALLALHSDRRELFLEITGTPTGQSLRDFRREVLREAADILVSPDLPISTHINRSPRRVVLDQLQGEADLHIPLTIQGRPVGVLSARLRRGPLEESSLRLIYTVSSQAALTIERVRTVEEAELLKIRAVLDSMSDGVLLLDRNLRIMLANPAARRHVERILGHAPPRRLVRLGEAAMAPIVEGLAQGGRSSTRVEISIEDPPQIYQITASSAIGLRGVFEGAVLVVSDVTEPRRLQEQLHQTEKLSSLGEMLSGVAHELNNPLASIIGFAQLLEGADLRPDIGHKVQAIGIEASRCHSIVQELLRFARRQQPERRAIDLNSVVGSVLQLLGYQLQADNITVDVDLDRGMKPVLGDFHALQQVFVNVIQNARQAMREQGGRGLLRIVTHCDGLSCDVAISDSGPGIRPEHLRRIFDPFFSTKGVGQGTGLGLSIAYSTVKAHGGEISATSRPGRGATIVATFPACHAAEEAAAAPARPAPVEPVAVCAPGRILVVEDEIHLAEMIREALMAAGHQVDSAGDGATASEMVRAGRYDLIISDLKMPNMSGRELYEEVRRIDPTLARRIIFSTGDSVSAETQAFFNEIGNPYLTKPFNLRDLYLAVNTALRDA